MSVAIVTGSAGLVGAEACRLFASRGLRVAGVDNDMRRYFFGADASTDWSRRSLEKELRGYEHVAIDIRDEQGVDRLFQRFGKDVVLVLHTAAQPSHDWAAREPMTDFSVNAQGTLVLLEATRRHCPDAAFVFTSTNKVYGDTPNSLPLVELATRWEVAADHPYHAHGIDERMTIDASMHSIFGASKVAADVMVQEYGRYFGMRTACFRGGCLTGPGHSGAQLHGFLAYLMKCAITGTPYTVFGYKGKQVRDNIHSHDLVTAFWHYFQKPRPAAVYNIGGGRFSNCSMLEAIAMCEELTGRPVAHTYAEANRAGDHVWWISDVRKFRGDFPEWRPEYDIRRILTEMHEQMAARLRGG